MKNLLNKIGIILIGTFLVVGSASAASVLFPYQGGTGIDTYATGDTIHADATNHLVTLPGGANGLVYKMTAGVPDWQPDLQGSGGAGLWSTTTDSEAQHPSDTSRVVLIGNNATTSLGNILEVLGNSFFRGISTTTGKVSSYSFMEAPYFNATSTTATSTFAGGVDITGITNLGNQLDLNDNEIIDVGFMDFNLTNGIAQSEGRLVWNPTDGTLNLGLTGGNVNLQIGQEQLILGKNTTGTGTTNCRPARISAASGSKPEFDFTDTDVLAESGSIGLFTEDINNNSNGYLTTFGLVRDCDTSGSTEGESWASADLLYASSTPGRLTNVMPTGSERKTFMGVIININATTGIIWVSPINTSYFNELSGPNLTQNSVPFVGSDSNLTEDTANFVWDDTNNRLGIGTTTPSTTLSVDGLSTLNGTTTIDGNSSGSTDGSSYDLSIGNGGGTGIIKFSNRVTMGVATGTQGALDLDGVPFIRTLINPDSEIQFIFQDNDGEVRLALAEPGVGKATHHPRSMTIAGPTVDNNNIITCSFWGFWALPCNTGANGADLGVQNNLQVLGDTYLGGNVTASSTLTLEGSGTDMLLSLDSNGSVVATSTPTMDSFFATSTTATSTIAGGLAIETTGFVYDFAQNANSMSNRRFTFNPVDNETAFILRDAGGTALPEVYLTTSLEPLNGFKSYSGYTALSYDVNNQYNFAEAGAVVSTDLGRIYLASATGGWGISVNTADGGLTIGDISDDTNVLIKADNITGSQKVVQHPNESGEYLLSSTTANGVSIDYTNGRLGIGTTSPYVALAVAGDIVMDSFNATSTTATSTIAHGLNVNALNVTSSTATSTFANGIDLSAGCFSIAGVCVGGGGGSGTVTSVAQTVPLGLTISGSPVTTSGTLAIAYDTGYEGILTVEKTIYNNKVSSSSIDTFAELDTLVADKNMCNLDDAQIFTSLIQFTGGASSTAMSIFDELKVGGSSTTTIDNVGNTTIGGFLKIPSAADPVIDEANKISINTSTSSLMYHDGVAERVVSPFGFGGLPFASSTLAYSGNYSGSGTTTILMANPPKKLTLTEFFVKLQGGTSAQVCFGDGNATTTCAIGTPAGVLITPSVNNSWERFENLYIEIGNQVGNPDIITVSPSIRKDE